jgi:hypothetical protein
MTRTHFNLTKWLTFLTSEFRSTPRSPLKISLITLVQSRFSSKLNFWTEKLSLISKTKSAYTWIAMRSSKKLLHKAILQLHFTLRPDSFVIRDSSWMEISTLSLRSIKNSQEPSTRQLQTFLIFQENSHLPLQTSENFITLDFMLSLAKLLLSKYWVLFHLPLGRFQSDSIMTITLTILLGSDGRLFSPVGNLLKIRNFHVASEV